MPSTRYGCRLGLVALQFSEIRAKSKERELLTAKITAKGQITIPKEIRIQLSVKPGDRLAFDVDDQGTLHAVPFYDSGKPLYGFLSRLATRPSASVEDFDEGIARHMIDKFSQK